MKEPLTNHELAIVYLASHLDEIRADCFVLVPTRATDIAAAIFTTILKFTDPGPATDASSPLLPPYTRQLPDPQSASQRNPRVTSPRPRKKDPLP